MKYLLIISMLFGSVAFGAPSPHTRHMQEVRRQERVSISRRDILVRDIETGKMGRVTERALTKLLSRAERVLTKKGHRDEARAMMAQYEPYRATLLRHEVFGVSSLELGDFEPMFVWLDALYEKLKDTLGESVMESTKLVDIWRLNHALRVVFFPGDNRWDQAEYVLHFKPFMQVIGYWGVMAGCTYANMSLMEKLVCSPIALAGRTVFGFIGGPLGKLIYKATTGDQDARRSLLSSGYISTSQID